MENGKVYPYIFELTVHTVLKSAGHIIWALSWIICLRLRSLVDDPLIGLKSLNLIHQKNKYPYWPSVALVLGSLELGESKSFQMKLANSFNNFLVLLTHVFFAFPYI